MSFPDKSVLPGFYPTFSLTILWLALLVLLPLSTLLVNTLTIGFAEIPLYEVKNGTVTGVVKYFEPSALEELTIAPAGTNLPRIQKSDSNSSQRATVGVPNDLEEASNEVSKAPDQAKNGLQTHPQKLANFDPKVSQLAPQSWLTKTPKLANFDPKVSQLSEQGVQSPAEEVRIKAKVFGEWTEVSPEEVEYLEATRAEKFLYGIKRGFPKFFGKVFDKRTLASFRVTFGTALAAALVNLFLGGVVAYALMRVKMPGKKIVDALIDLPFAMPTAICGIAMVTMYAPKGPIGKIFAKLGIQLAFTPIGIVLALLFIGLPFVVRALQPALEDLGTSLEEASLSLGATRFQTWRRVIVPELSPALLSGFTLAFARGLGEYGTVIFIAGNTPMKTEITSLLIVTQLEQFDYSAATAIAVAMLGASLLMIFGVNWYFTRRHHHARA